MIKNYIISALRSLKGDRLYASINTIGLAIGLATGFLIFSWVKQELKYDQSYQGHDYIYRVTTGWDDNPDEGIASTYPMMKDKVLANFPEIEGTTRLYNTSLLGSRSRISIDDKTFTDSKIYYGDTTFFTLFPFNLISGSKAHLFDLPNSAIISKRSAERYFGNEDPIGKIILLNNSQELVVTGIIENIPTTTHFKIGRAHV
jgi:putative ABC transport system permease protein